MESIRGDRASGNDASNDLGFAGSSIDGRYTKIKATSNTDDRLDRFGADANRAETMGEFRKTERLYKEILEITENTEGSDQLRVAEIRMAIANLYYRRNELTEAEQYDRRAIKILETAYGNADHRYARALNNLATVLYRQGRYSDAEALYKRALTIFYSKLGPNHPYVDQTVSNLRQLYQIRFEYKDARPSTDQSADDKDQDRVARLSSAAPPAANSVGSNQESSTKTAKISTKTTGPAASTGVATDADARTSPKLPKKQILLVEEGSWKTVSAKGKDVATADLKKLTYSWDLDDDGEFETTGATVRFDASQIDGPHSRVIRVRVSDDDGGSIIGSITAQVANVPPTADAGGPYQVMEGSSIDLVATGNDAAPADRAGLAFIWDLDGDGVFEASGKTVPFHATTIDGPKSIKIGLRVSDDDGGVTEVVTTVVVVNAPPRIDAADAYVVEEGSTVTLDTKGSDPSPADAKNLTYAWDLDGNGTFETVGRTVRFDAGEIDGPSKRSVNVLVTDDDGGAQMATVEVAVTNAPPSLDVGGPYTVDEGGSVTVSATGDDRVASDRENLTYAWDLDGDGTFETTGRTVRFDAANFDGPISHTAQVRVSDDDGGITTGEVKITIKNLAPTLVRGRTFIVAEGGKVKIHVLATDASAADAAKLVYKWDLDGDGTFEASGTSVVFDATGIDGPTSRRVKVRVSDDDGGFVDGDVEVKIKNLAPESVTIHIEG